MTSPAAWMLIPVALDEYSFAHPWTKLALRLDIRHGVLAEGWPVLKLRKPKWEN